MVNRLRAAIARWLDPAGLLRRAGYALGLCAIAALLLAARTAIDRAMPNLAVLFAAAGLAMLAAAGLMVARRRADLVSDLLGGLTGGSFAISLAALATATPAMDSETVFASFQPPIFFAAWLIVWRRFLRRLPWRAARTTVKIAVSTSTSVTPLAALTQ